MAVAPYAFLNGATPVERRSRCVGNQTGGVEMKVDTRWMERRLQHPTCSELCSGLSGNPPHVSCSPQGGIAFVAIKGAFKVYFKQQQYLRQAHRKILNFPEPEEA